MSVNNNMPENENTEEKMLMQRFAAFLRSRDGESGYRTDCSDVPDEYAYEHIMSEDTTNGIPLPLDHKMRGIEREYAVGASTNAQDKASRRHRRSIKHLAKVCVIMLLITGVSLGGIAPHAQALRQKLYDILFVQNDGNADIVILGNGRPPDDEVDEDTLRREQAESEALMKEKEGQVLYPVGLPDRYKVMEIDKSMGGYMTSLWFEGDSEEDFIWYDYKFDEQVRFNTDTEHTKLSEILINGNDAVMMTSKGGYYITWVEDGTARNLNISNAVLNEEEAVNIAESLEWVDESSIEASESESQLAA